MAESTGYALPAPRASEDGRQVESYLSSASGVETSAATAL